MCLILIKGVKFAYANSSLTNVNALVMPTVLKDIRKQEKEKQQQKEVMNFVLLK